MAKEIPYSKINPRELKDLEAEFGRTLTPELAHCLIRYRINRDAIDLMLRGEPAPGSFSSREVSEMKPPKPAAKSEDSQTELKNEEGLKSGRQRGSGRGAHRTGSGAARKAVA